MIPLFFFIKKKDIMDSSSSSQSSINTDPNSLYGLQCSDFQSRVFCDSDWAS